jgi:proline dehydrogenase
MLARLVPGFLVRFFARPYVAGSSLEDAVQTVVDAHDDRGLLSTLDLLGEDVVEPAQVERQVGAYRDMLQRSEGDARLRQRPRPTVSVKPSGFTCTALEDAKAPLYALAQEAHERGVPLTIDMEDRRWTDLTLAWAVELFERGWDIGTVLQTRLNRTLEDVERIPAGMRIRLVIGIYPEPADIATTDKEEMKGRMLQCAKRLLERGAKVEFATHDERYLERFAREVAPAAPDRCEVQLLLGVPRDGVIDAFARGDFGVRLPVRLYVPFALSWSDATAYLRRRMEESPSMVWLVLANLLRRRRRRGPAALRPPERGVIPAESEKA